MEILGGKIIKLMIGLVCKKEFKGGTWDSGLGNLIVHAIKQRDSRGGGGGLREKMMSAISLC